MFIRSFSSILIVSSSFILAFGQPTAPQPPTPNALSWHFAGSDSYLGVQMTEVNKENFSKYGLRDVRGVAVEKVIENSPAAQAGIQAGDVIVRFNGEEVTSNRKLTRLISEVDPDHQVKVTVIRSGSERDITATLGKRPATAFKMGNFEFPFGKFDMPTVPDLKGLEKLKDLEKMHPIPDGKVWTFPGGEGKSYVWRGGEHRVIGVGITPLTKQLATHFGVDGGALVNEVRENSPAAKAGIQAGDIIVDVDGVSVKSQMDLIKSVNNKKDGSLTITVVRRGNRQSLTVTPEVSKDGGFMFDTVDGQDG
jgi:membrane-associated protease RseP (regulator of RpoE activity)